MNDRQRFERIYVDHYDAVLRYCLRRTNREDALDTAAETFTVAWRRRADVPLDRELPWLYGVARRLLANQHRSNARRTALAARVHVVDGNGIADPEIQVLAGQDASDVHAALSRLTPADREVIRLAGWEGLDRTALAETLDCSPNAVTKRLNRALDRLGRELGVVERTRSRFFRRGQVAR